MHQFDLNNRTAIITGGAQGFGLDIAKRFLNSGVKTIIWDIDENELKKATQELNNPNLSYKVVDVSNYKNVKETVDEITKSTNIDILINNAGITGSTSTLWDYDVEEWNKIIQINLMGTFNCCKCVVPNMIKNNYDKCLILEDDFMLNSDFHDKFNILYQNLPKQWDVILFENRWIINKEIKPRYKNIHKKDIVDDNNYFFKTPYGCQDAGCYAITSNTAKILKKKYLPIRGGADGFMGMCLDRYYLLNDFYIFLDIHLMPLL